MKSLINFCGVGGSFVHPFVFNSHLATTLVLRYDITYIIIIIFEPIAQSTNLSLFFLTVFLHVTAQFFPLFTSRAHRDKLLLLCTVARNRRQAQTFTREQKRGLLGQEFHRRVLIEQDLAKHVNVLDRQ